MSSNIKMALLIKTILERFKREWRGFSRKPPFIEYSRSMSRRYGEKRDGTYIAAHTSIVSHYYVYVYYCGQKVSIISN